MKRGSSRLRRRPGRCDARRTLAAGKKVELGRRQALGQRGGIECDAGMQGLRGRRSVDDPVPQS
jgi:hypothetical protein